MAAVRSRPLQKARLFGEIRQVQQKKEPGIENYRSDECGGTKL